jgi:hypothetical protein
MPKIDVYPLVRGVGFPTTVWISDAAADEIRQHHDAIAIGHKLEHFARAGFVNFEGSDNVAIRHEGRGVFRIRHKKSSNFRMFGFYSGGKSEFILIDAFDRKGSKYTKGQQARYMRIADVRDSGNWRKVED